MQPLEYAPAALAAAHRPSSSASYTADSASPSIIESGLQVVAEYSPTRPIDPDSRDEGYSLLDDCIALFESPSARSWSRRIDDILATCGDLPRVAVVSQSNLVRQRLLVTLAAHPFLDDEAWPLSSYHSQFLRLFRETHVDATERSLDDALDHVTLRTGCAECADLWARYSRLRRQLGGTPIEVCR